MWNLRGLISCSTVLGVLSSAALAQEAVRAFPSKPVVLIVPITPGGAIDQEARLYAKMSGLLGQPFIVDYKPGAGTTIGSAYVAKSAPDGYTLLVNAGGLTTAPALYSDLSFDVVKDFAPISLMTEKPYVLVVSPQLPANSVAEYLAYAKANPGKINFGTTGGGSVSHLVGAWLHGATNTKVTFVHYKGSGGTIPDLLTGRLDATSTALVGVFPHIKAGKLRALGLTGDKRSSLLPGVLTIADQGVSGFNYTLWQGVLAPGATPPAIVSRLSDVFSRIAKAPEVAGPLEAAGSVMVGSTAEQFRQIIVTEIASWRKVVRDAGITLEE